MSIENKNSESTITISPSSKYVRKDSYILRKIAGSNVLVAIGEGVADFRGYIKLNESARYLWELLESPRTEEELIEQFHKCFEATEDTIAKDVSNVLAMLLQKGMINVC